MPTRPNFTPRIRIPATSFPQTVNVARAVQTIDTSGGRSVTTPDESPLVYQNVNVSIQDQGATEVNINGRLLAVLNHLVYTKTHLSLMNGDFILYGSRVLVVKAFRDIAEIGALFEIKCIEYMTKPLV